MLYIYHKCLKKSYDDMQISKKPFKVLFSLYLKDNNSFHFNGPLSSNYVLLRCFYFALKRKNMELKGAWRLRQTDFLPMQFFEIKQNSELSILERTRATATTGPNYFHLQYKPVEDEQNTCTRVYIINFWMLCISYHCILCCGILSDLYLQDEKWVLRLWT